VTTVCAIVAVQKPPSSPVKILVGIAWVNPDGVKVAMSVRSGAELLPPFTLTSKSVVLKTCFILGINNQVGKVKRTPHHV